MLLLNPGPVTLTERVRRSLLQPDLCHRESEFFDLQEEARTRLLNVSRLDPDRAFTHVAVIHHETTTGRLNDLRALGAVCRSRGLHLLVDGVSSFGAEAIDFGDDAIAAVAATANKCLHGVPGAAFV